MLDSFDAVLPSRLDRANRCLHTRRAGRPCGDANMPGEANYGQRHPHQRQEKRGCTGTLAFIEVKWPTAPGFRKPEDSKDLCEMRPAARWANLLRALVRSVDKGRCRPEPNGLHCQGTRPNPTEATLFKNDCHRAQRW